MTEEQRRAKYNSAHTKEIVRIAKNFDRQEWKVILMEAPIEGLFYALMHKIMRILDTNRKYEQVKPDIELIYGDDDLGEWL